MICKILRFVIFYMQNIYELYDSNEMVDSIKLSYLYKKKIGSYPGSWTLSWNIFVVILNPN